MKIAFIKTVGLSSGGGERYLQTMASLLVKAGHKVDYFYTNNAPCLGTDWRHPPHDEARRIYIESMGVNAIPVHVDTIGELDWIGTDLFEKFSEKNYDVVGTARGGYPEYPFTKLDTVKIVDSIHGVKVHNKPNIKKSILLCKWQADLWIKNGGDVSKLEIVPSLVYVPEKTADNYRKELGIPDDAFVYGYHQRNENGLFSPIPLRAFQCLQTEQKNIHFVIMGGGETHRNYADHHGLKNVHFIDHTSDTVKIHKFLQTLNCYSHSKSSGEVCSVCIIEAMYHGLPIISHPGNDMGHLEMIDGCGKMTYNLDEYVTEMRLLKNSKPYWQYKNGCTLQKYEQTYNYSKLESRIQEIYKSVENI